MNDYAELIKALQCASHFALYQDCYEKNCYANSGKGLYCNIPKLMADAADALEEMSNDIEKHYIPLLESWQKRAQSRLLKIQEMKQETEELLSETANVVKENERLKAQLPKEGEWIEKWRFKTDGTPFHKIGDMECSVCHGDMLGRYYSKYCPHCGALLRGEHDERTNKA